MIYLFYGDQRQALDQEIQKILGSDYEVIAGEKLTADLLLPFLEEGKNEHTVLPRLVYISDATETGGVYTKAELTALSDFCRSHGLLLFLDGARLGAAFAAESNDLTLPDLARLTDAFYIGGTKNGALMGEALVIVNPALQEGFFRIKKQRGAVLAKGWLLGLQFQTLLEDGLYWTIARHAVDMAQALQSGLEAMGIPMAPRSATNMVFPAVPDSLLPVLDALCAYEVWTRQDERHTVIRLVTSFATQADDVEGFLSDLKAAL